MIHDSPSIKDLFQKGRALLSGISESPNLDTEILLSEVLQKSREWILTHSEEITTHEGEKAFLSLVQRRKNGEAISEILGRKEFFGREFLVNQDVLTPRPETELLVEKALALCERFSFERIIDIGTGSGCIAITVLKELEQKKNYPPDKGEIGGFYESENQSKKSKVEKYRSIQSFQKESLEFIALDISDEALSVAKENAKKHEVLENILFIRSDLLFFISPKANDLFVANLPYIPAADILPIEVQKGDPDLALFSGEDGLDAYRTLFKDLAKRWNTIPFSIVFEFHPPQKETLEALFQELFEQKAQWEFYRDYSGKWRGATLVSFVNFPNSSHGV
jgi:release factor glutamine methyltransferase